MRIIFLIILSLVIFQSCGKKSDPEYQVKKEPGRISII